MLCKSPLENNSGTLPNPLSRSFRTIGVCNNFPATASSLRCSTYTYALSISSTKANFRVDARLLVSCRGTGRQSLPTSFAYSPRTFSRKQSHHHQSITYITSNTQFSNLLPWVYSTLVRAAFSTDTGHALRMTNARPPWQRGRRKPTKDRRRKKEPPELQARTRWSATEARVGAKYRQREREGERNKKNTRRD